MKKKTYVFLIIAALLAMSVFLTACVVGGWNCHCVVRWIDMVEDVFDEAGWQVEREETNLYRKATATCGDDFFIFFMGRSDNPSDTSVSDNFWIDAEKRAAELGLEIYRQDNFIWYGTNAGRDIFDSAQIIENPSNFDV